MKKFNILLVLILFLGATTIAPFNASAATTATIITQNEAKKWLEDQRGTVPRNPADGGHLGQCASLAAQYYLKLTGRIIRTDSGAGTGHGYQYADNNHSVNLGWSRGFIAANTVLELGDVIVTGHPNGGITGNHVAIFYSGTATSASQIESAQTLTGGVTKQTFNANLVGKTYVRPVWKNAGPVFVPLDTPRFMQVRDNNTYKIDVFTGQKAGDPLSTGQQIKFIDKIFINGKWYLRTEFNYNDGKSHAIALEQLVDIPYQPITSKLMTFSRDGWKSVPSTQTPIDDSYAKNTTVKIVDEITVNGEIYYRTQFDHDDNNNRGISSEFLVDFSPIPLDDSRNFIANKNTQKLDILTGQIQPISLGTTLFISRKTIFNGSWYFQAQSDSGTNLFINSNDLSGGIYLPFEKPRSMVLNQDIYSINPLTKEKIDLLNEGQDIEFSTKTLLDGEWYFRTDHDTRYNKDVVVPASSLSEIPYQPISPKLMTFKSDGNKIIPAAQISSDNLIVKGTTVKVVDQIIVNGKVYYRTQFDHDNGENYGISSESLIDFSPVPLDNARHFIAARDTQKIDLLTSQTQTVSAGTTLYITEKTIFDGIWYFQAQSDNGTNKFINSIDLSDMINYVTFEKPRSMVLNRDVYRINPFTGKELDLLKKGQIISLSTKIFLNGEWYFRTAYNTERDDNAVIPSSAFSEL